MLYCLLESQHEIKFDPIYFPKALFWSHCRWFISAHYCGGKQMSVFVSICQNVITCTSSGMTFLDDSRSKIYRECSTLAFPSQWKLLGWRRTTWKYTVQNLPNSGCLDLQPSYFEPQMPSDYSLCSCRKVTSWLATLIGWRHHTKSHKPLISGHPWKTADSILHQKQTCFNIILNI